jgi:hypothetical protein
VVRWVEDREEMEGVSDSNEDGAQEIDPRRVRSHAGALACRRLQHRRSGSLPLRAFSSHPT